MQTCGGGGGVCVCVCVCVCPYTCLLSVHGYVLRGNGRFGQY